MIAPAVIACTPPDSTVLANLLTRCGRREQDAFEAYYRLTSPLLNTLIGRQVSSPPLAEALLVACYVSVWHKAEDFIAGGPHSAWEWTLQILRHTLAVVDPRALHSV